MPDTAPLSDRLKRGLVRLDAGALDGPDAQARGELRRSLERTIARLDAAGEAALFGLRVTGGSSLLFHGQQALPLEASRLSRLLSAVDVELQSGETLDLDGGLAAWLIRPEVNLVDTNLRHVEESLRGMRSNRDRDHAASQLADTQKVRLRSRLTLLVGALQAAQRESAGPSTPAAAASP